MKTIPILLMLILGACNSIDNKTHPTDQKVELSSSKSPLSMNVDKYIKKKLPGWILAPSVSWADSSFNNYRSDTTQINYVSGDFNCDGTVDYSLILKDTIGNFSIVEIISFDEFYYHRELEHFDSYKTKKLDFGLQALAPGPIFHPSGLPPTVAECGAIQKFFVNRNSKRIYYRDKEGRSYVMQFGE